MVFSLGTLKSKMDAAIDTTCEPVQGVNPYGDLAVTVVEMDKGTTGGCGYMYSSSARFRKIAAAQVVNL